MTNFTQQWSQNYGNLVDRNIGLLTEEQQERLRTSKVAVFGMGGIGGTAFEVLVRCGIGTFSIVDKDTFEPTNMNRQIFAYPHTMGRMKIDVAAEWAKQINPDIRVGTFERVGEDNIAEIIRDADVIVQGIDQLKPCIIASRKAREMGIPLVEGWAIPYGNVRTFTAQTPTLEEAYGLPTIGRDVSAITDEEFTKLGIELLLGLGKIEGVADFYNEGARKRIAAGRLTSFAPMVWLTSVLMAMETVKVLLNWGEIAFGPNFTLYDPFKHRIPRGTP
ncbi:MAG: hypothetical protein ED859_00035 [Desulfuromonadales bacterium]|nr:MAG: hypothetical protein ED859_00035 [Desulfuromonadales bacterium]